MRGAAFDMILNTPGCRGAFRLRGDGMEAIKQDDATLEAAERTRALWASLNAVIPDAGIIIGRREGGVSVASELGGMILEGDTMPNLGILRSALRNETADRPELSEARLTPAAQALLTLARWIDETETRRLFLLTAGAQRVRIWARKGRFALGDLTPADVARVIRDAAAEGAEITLGLEPWAEPPTDIDLAPTDLLAGTRSAHWIFADCGTPKALPESATLAEAARATALAGRLIAWGQGKSFEVEVLGAGSSRRVVAQSTGPDTIELRF